VRKVENESESELYLYLSEVGIRRKSPGRIDFNPVDLDRVLEAIVADGDNFLLERMYSYAKPGWDFILSVALSNPGLKPDTSEWDEEQKKRYEFNNEIVYQEGVWCHPQCYNIRTDKVEDFNPIAFHPSPERFEVLDLVQDYRRLLNQAIKAKSLGYILDNVEIEEPKDLLFQLGFTRESHHHYFNYKNLQSTRKFFGHIIPGLK